MLWTGQFSSGRIGCGELKREARRVLWLRTEETRGGAHAGAQRGEGDEPRASTLPGDAGKQAAACPHGRSRCCAHGGRVGQGASDPYRVTVATLIPSFLNFVKFSRNLNWSQICVKTKVVPNFISYKTCFGDQS